MKMNADAATVVTRRARLTEALRGIGSVDVGLEPRPEPGRPAWEPSGAGEILVAGTRALREQAWGLVHDAYVSKGYMESCPSKMRLQLQDALPEATTFLAVERPGGKALATLTVYPDGPLGLPMDVLYRRELDELRAAGRKPCEIAKLVADLDGQDGRRTLLDLFRLAYLTARRLEACTDLVVTVNPRHERYYRRLLMFEQIGEVKAYDAVGGAPAVPLRLDLEAAERCYRERSAAGGGQAGIYSFFVSGGEEATLDWLRRERLPMSADDFRYFFMRRTRLPHLPTADERALLEFCYRASDPGFRLPAVPAEQGTAAPGDFGGALFASPGLVH
jgi:hypothetical protein